jgi:uridine kinase
VTKIVGISGISGAGTTTITTLLGAALNGTTVYWDDFDDISQSPADYIEWLRNNGDYADWHYPALEKTLKQLKDGRSVMHPAKDDELFSSSIVVFDAPLGRKHHPTGQYIDYQFHLNTSMDIALARRMLRDYRHQESAATAILDELEWYLTAGRPLFDATEVRNAADFIVNGDLATKEIISVITDKLVDISYITSLK